jgi:hypothetical protein
VAPGVGPEFKPQYCKNNNNKKNPSLSNNCKTVEMGRSREREASDWGPPTLLFGNTLLWLPGLVCEQKSGQWWPCSLPMPPGTQLLSCQELLAARCSDASRYAILALAQPPVDQGPFGLMPSPCQKATRKETLSASLLRELKDLQSFETNLCLNHRPMPEQMSRG